MKRNLFFYIIIIFCFASYYDVAAQTECVRIVSSNSQNDETAVAYAKVIKLGTVFGLSADELGVVCLDAFSETDTIVVAAMGFYTDTILVDNIRRNKIQLRERIYQLGTTEIIGHTAKGLMYQLINKVSEINKAEQKSYYYRQVHIEDGTYVRAIESCLEVQFPKHEGRDEKFCIQNIKRSPVLEKNGETHGNHLVDLFQLNPVFHPTGSPFNKKALELYEFKIDTIHYNKGDHLYKISFRYLARHREQNKSGTILLTYPELLLKSFQVTTLPNKNYIPNSVSNTGKYDWSMVRSNLQINYTYKNDQLLTKNLSLKYTHHLRKWNNRNIAYTVDEKFECFLIEDLNDLNKKFTYEPDLYEGPFPSDSTYWKKIELPSFLEVVPVIGQKNYDR